MIQSAIFVLNIIHKDYSEMIICCFAPESPHDKTKKLTINPAKSQISLAIFYTKTSILAWKSMVTKIARMSRLASPRLIWVSSGLTSHFTFCYVIAEINQQLISIFVMQFLYWNIVNLKIQSNHLKNQKLYSMVFFIF